MTTFDSAAATQAREAALQMLYQWEVGRVSVDEAVADVLAGAATDRARRRTLRAFADALVRGTTAQAARRPTR